MMTQAISLNLNPSDNNARQNKILSFLQKLSVNNTSYKTKDNSDKQIKSSFRDVKDTLIKTTDSVYDELTDLGDALITGKYKGKKIKLFNKSDNNGSSLLDNILDAASLFTNRERTVGKKGRFGRKLSALKQTALRPVDYINGKVTSLKQTAMSLKDTALKPVNLVKDKALGLKNSAIGKLSSVADGATSLAKGTAKSVLKGASKLLGPASMVLSGLDLANSLATGDAKGIGSSIGSMAGGALGGFIGSIVPGAGTALGMMVGSFLGDLAGSAIGGLFSSDDEKDKTKAIQNSGLLDDSSVKLNSLNMSNAEILQKTDEIDSKLKDLGIKDTTAPVVVVNKADMQIDEEKNTGFFNSLWNGVKSVGSKITSWLGFGNEDSPSTSSRGNAAAMPNVGETYSGLGSIVSQSETGGRGTAMISSGKGDYGGVSYGRNQLSSTRGSIDSFLNWAKSNGYQDIYDQLAPLKGDATSSSGEFAKKWSQLASEKGGRLEQLDREYQVKYYYGKGLAKIQQQDAKLAERIQANPALQEQLLSTATQYGENSNRYFRAAKEVLNINPTATDEELIEGIQDIKVRDIDKDFSKSSANTRAGVRNRHNTEERNRLLSLNTSFQKGELPFDGGNKPESSNSGNINPQDVKYDGSSEIRLTKDGKRIDLNSVQGVSSLTFMNDKVNIDKMNPSTVKRLAAMAQEYEQKTGKKLPISEGFRDYAEQVRLYNELPQGRAARPGASSHGTGVSFDIVASQVNEINKELSKSGTSLRELATKYGFTNNVKSEDWHFTDMSRLTEEMQKDRKAGKSGIKTGIDYLSEEERRMYQSPGEGLVAQIDNTPQNKSAKVTRPGVSNKQVRASTNKPTQLAPAKTAPSLAPAPPSSSYSPTFNIPDPAVQSYRIDPIRPAV